MLITENGIATDDDTLRRDYLVQHIRGLGEAIASGLDVIGYLYWSLIDNFEWALGTTARFGLAEVDYSTQERTLRPSASFFERVCRENRLSGGPD
jgi:beta-glucosidase